MIWLDQIIQGTLLGGYYALIACGLSLMFGVMRIINLAHGDFAVLGAFAVWLLATQIGISPFNALAAAIPLMALLGWGLQHWIFERSLRAGPLVPLLATFGLAIVIENLLFEKFSADTRSLAPEIGDLAFDSWALPGQIYVGHLAVLVFAVAVVLLVGLQILLKWTAIGRAIRATAEDPDTAELVGVNSRAVYAVAAAVAVSTTAVAGTFLAMRATFAEAAVEFEPIAHRHEPNSVPVFERAPKTARQEQRATAADQTRTNRRSCRPPDPERWISRQCSFVASRLKQIDADE